MPNSIDGFYAAYFTGRANYGFGLVVFKEGKIVGVDVDGVKFDGSYRVAPDEQCYSATLVVKAPPNYNLVQGINTGDEGIEYTIDSKLPLQFDPEQFIPLSTSLGPVNIRLVKLRDI